jgi:hypothetical protein
VHCIVRHCVVSNGTDIDGMQLVVSWTVDVDCHGRAAYGWEWY